MNAEVKIATAQINNGYQTEYEKKKMAYQIKYPSEAKLLTTKYYSFKNQ